MGYDSILWLDASMVVIRPIDPIFRQIEEEGHLLFKNPPWLVGQWCSDEALRVFSLDREEALGIPEVDGCTVGLNMHNETAVEFLIQWHARASDGMTFRGVKEKLRNQKDYEAVKWNENCRVSTDRRVMGHRHDQTAAGIIAYRLGMRLSDNGSLVKKNYTAAIKKSVILFLMRDPSVSLNRIWMEIHFYWPLTALVKSRKAIVGVVRTIRGLLRG